MEEKEYLLSMGDVCIVDTGAENGVCVDLSVFDSRVFLSELLYFWIS